MASIFRRRSGFGLALLTVSALACGGDTPTEENDPDPPADPVPTTVDVTPTALSFASIGETAQATAVVLDQDGEEMVGEPVTWSVDPAGVVSVSTAGEVNAVANGSATVTATAGTASGDVPATVDQVAATVTLDVDTLVLLGAGDTATVVAAVWDDEGTAIGGADVVWSVTDEGVATINGNGHVTSVAEGMTMATAQGTAGGATVDGDFFIEVRSLVLSPSDFCGDYPPEAIATFGSTHMNNVVRDTLGLAAGEDMTCTLLATIDSLRVLPYGLAVNTLSGAQNLTGAVYLHLAGNNFSDVSPLANLTGLKWLGLENGEVDDIAPLAGLDNLEFLNLYNNDVTDITPLSGLTGLRNLGISSNPFGSSLEPIAGLTGLETLSIGATAVSDLSPISGMTGLVQLNAGYTAVTDVSPIQNLTSLERLYLHNNDITDISSLSGLDQVTILWLKETGISDLTGLSGMTALEDLYLYTNEIADLSELAGLTNLTKLRLYNQVTASDTTYVLTDVGPLQGLVNLTLLVLHTNYNLTNIQPLLDNTGLGSGDEVNLVFTNVSCSDIDALKAKGVTVVSVGC